jgi:NifU-like protein
MSPKKHYVCECLKVTEADVVEAIRAYGIRDIKDVIGYTQAGDGCTACHPALMKLCERERKRGGATCPPLPPCPSAQKDSSAVQAAL